MTPGPRVGLRAGGKTSSSFGTASSVKRRLCKGQASSHSGTASGVQRVLRQHLTIRSHASSVASSSSGQAVLQPHGPHSVEDSAVWVCDECRQPVTALTQSKLAHARDRHIAKHHARIPRDRFHVLYKQTGIVKASTQIPWTDGGWECAGCEARLAPIPQRHQRSVSIKSHLENCPYVSKNNRNASSNSLALIRKYGGSPSLVRVLKPHKGGMKGTNLCLSKIAGQFRELYDLQQKSNHVLCRIERDSDKGRDRTTSHNVAYTCSTCMQVWKWAPYLRIDIEAGLRCKEAAGRAENLRSGSTRQFFRKGSDALQRDLCKVWKLSANEKHAFALKGDALRKHLGRGSTREHHTKRRAQVILARRTDRALWVSRHLKNARRAKLVEEGIEPHPGPLLSTLSINIAGEDNFCGFLNYLEAENPKPDVVALQELSFTHASLGRAVARADHFGFRLIFAPPQVGNERRLRGTGWLVKNNLASVTLESFSNTSGAVTFIELQGNRGIVLASIWLQPGTHDINDLWNLVVSRRLVASQRGQQCCIIGDFNLTPSENFLAGEDMQILAYTDEDGFVPTRWDGSRAIDYCLLSPGLKGNAVGFWDAHFSDHKAMSFNLQFDLPRLNFYVVAPTSSLAKCVDREAMREAVHLVWSQVDTTPPPEVVGCTDDEWHWFSALLEHILLTASTSINNPLSRGLRQKGSAPSLLPAAEERLAACRAGTYSERTFRKLLGRLREVQRQRRCGRRCDELMNKIKSDWPSDIPWQGLGAAVQQIEAALAQLVKLDKDRALHEWKQALR